MNFNYRGFAKGLVKKKPISVLLQEGHDSEMKRALGKLDLIGIGIGAIIGTGIFVLTGIAAATHAGPAIVLSFVFAAIVAGIAAFSYSELASMVPVSGSAYTYTFATMGELMAWVIGWDLMLEYLVGAATVAVGWSGYVVNFFHSAFGVTIPHSISSSPLVYASGGGGFSVSEGAYINVPAIFVSLAVTVLLLFGVRESTMVNNVIVMVKLFVILVFIFGSIRFIDPVNYDPFIPESVNGEFGVIGIFKGAQQVFFAYIGFDAVSTAAQECKNPQSDLPWGICISLMVCTVLYIAVAAVLTGIAPYQELNNPSPITVALVQYPGTAWMRILIDIGAIAGLTSVILIMLMAQPRVFMSMASDGLFPKMFAKIHPKFKTPFFPTMITGITCAVLSGVLPVDVLGDMTSVGTLLAFGLVNAGVVILRYTQPDAERGFRVPLSPFVPAIGSIICAFLIVISDKLTIVRLLIWLLIGLIVYFAYGHRNSYINHPEKAPAHYVNAMAEEEKQTVETITVPETKG